MKYVVFEDGAWKNFLPFTYTRFTGDMRAGVLKLRQRLGIYFDFEPENVVVRKDMENLYLERHDQWMVNNFPSGKYTFVNSRLRFRSDDLDKGSIYDLIQKLKIGQKLVSGEEILAFKIKLKDDILCSAEELFSLYEPLETIKTETENCLWNFTWELLEENGNLIKDDYKLAFYEEDNFMEIDPGVVAINPYDIWIGEGATLKHGVVLDASKGPIIIDENASIMHNAVIIGPAFIGKNSLIKIGAKIYGDTSIGPNCKVGGEVCGSIFQAYSNKQHDGFLGKSYLGEWVNIGADTNNSDLKNNYKPIKVWFYPEKSKKDTGNLFMGAFIGDHSKIGINCSINTGTVIGMGVNIFGSDLINHFVPSFSWGEAKNLVSYQIDSFLETTTIVKDRREKTLKNEEIELIKKIYTNIKEYEDKS